MGQRIIGLTGGIATGKSTVADYLQQHHGLPVLDADRYARQAVEPGSPVLSAILDRYGKSMELADGQLNRPKLGEIIFKDTSERRWLEHQIHPQVRRYLTAAMAALDQAGTVVQVIPLLFEAGFTDQVTEIWVVTCTPQQQRQRLIARNQLTRAQAQARIDSQMPLAAKVARADVVLDNSRPPSALWVQIDQALQHPRQ
ncbi:MAG: dephospho-CoA kinase [Cyanobacteria bacterium REEB459]|nr:dephospho-CoA kinase [Cyanobacteria bacterium REEB459]